MASWAFTSLAMLVGTLGPRMWPGWSVAIAALGLLAFYLRRFAGGIEFKVVTDYLWLLSAWDGGVNFGPHPPNAWAVFPTPFAVFLGLFAAAMLTVTLVERGRARPMTA